MATRKGTGDTDDFLGSEQPDFLLGRGGDDVLAGAGGNDTLDGGLGDDDLQGGAGRDKLIGGEGDDRLSGGAEADNLSGGEGDDRLNGGSAADILLGGIGEDVEQGGSGDDILNGGGGKDYLLGGAGDDRLMWDPKDFSVNGGLGFDTLSAGGATFNLVTATNLHAIEAIDLRGRGANTLVTDAASVVNVTETPHLLRIFGDSEDALELTGTWNRVRSSVAGFTRYTSGSAKVDVANDVAVTYGNHISLANLNGVNGVHIAGANISPTGTGDVNGDGFDDLLLGSPTNRQSKDGGSAYVIFGRAGGIADNLDLDHLKARQGMHLTATKTEHDAGAGVAIAGDLNHDGFDDMVVTTGTYDLSSMTTQSTYVVYGHAGSFPTTFAMDKVNGDNGYIVDNIPVDDVMGGALPVSGAGDFNGDGFEDFALGVATAYPGVMMEAGSVFVLFGGSSPYDSSVDIRTMPATEVWRINGAKQFDALGTAIASGDINGDGFDDLFINGSTATKSAYVVFGKASGFGTDLSIASLDGSNGFTVTGTQYMTNITVADLNGDGFDDLVMKQESLNSRSLRVVFGHDGGFSSTVSNDNLNGLNGFTIVSSDSSARLGYAISSAGDVNGDGYEDLLVGAHHATSGRLAFAGATYVVFGHGGAFDPQLDLAQMDIHQGLRIDGFAKNQFSGYRVAAAGDLNGDGYGDIAIGGPGMWSGTTAATADGTFIVYGRDFDHRVAFEGTSGKDILTGTASDESLVGGAGKDVLDGGAGSDVLIGGAGHDTLVWDAADHRIDGGTGIDTLRIDGAGQTLDLTLLPSKVITGINVLDLTGSGDNVLRLSLQDLLQATDHAALRVAGDSGDSVEVTTTGWAQLADQNIGSNAYHAYFNGSATLLIDSDITQQIPLGA